MKVIALTGRAGSGKDTAAIGLQILTGHLDPTWMAPTSTTGSVYDKSQELDWNKVFNPSIIWRNGPGDVDKWPSLKFAYPVYKMAAILIGYDVDRASDLMRNDFKESSFVIGLNNVCMTGREILQKLGTECGRNVFGDTTWLHRMHRDLMLLRGYVEGTVITDCRFPNEAEFLRDYYKATIIGITRENCKLEQSHPSELELNGITTDFHIYNDGTYGDLMHRVDEILHTLKISNHKYTW